VAAHGARRRSVRPGTLTGRTREVNEAVETGRSGDLETGASGQHRGRMTRHDWQLEWPVPLPSAPSSRSSSCRRSTSSSRGTTGRQRRASRNTFPGRPAETGCHHPHRPRFRHERFLRRRHARTDGRPRSVGRRRPLRGPADVRVSLQVLTRRLDPMWGANTPCASWTWSGSSDGEVTSAVFIIVTALPRMELLRPTAPAPAQRAAVAL
jgi:hypothetical protein